MSYIASHTRFVELMTELFQLDEAEALDFGLYRIIRRHNKEVREFLGEVKKQGDEKTLEGGQLGILLEQAFSKADDETDNETQSRIKALEKNLGLSPRTPVDKRESTLTALEKIPATHDEVVEYRLLLEQKAATQTAESDRNEVLNRLYQFFARHYQDGDFIVERRYSKDGSRYIRSTGEDTEFHWATEDMYYIKSGDIFTDYPIRLRNGQHFVFTVESEVLQQTRESLKPNDKAHYALNSIVPSEDGLRVVLDYKKGVQSDAKKNEIVAGICSKIPANEAEVKRWLNHFIVRNQSDFFIHKRLDAALTEDLDIFLKTEVLNTDQLLVEGDLPKRSIKVARVVRQVGKHIIDFLAALENFQKQLWEKKKLVFKTDYIITLDRIAKLAGSAWLDTQINTIVAKQAAEWKALGFGNYKNATDCIEITEGDLATPSSKRYLPLPVDTQHFDDTFKWGLLEAVTARTGLDESLDGVVIHSDNWQALNTLQEKYKEQVKCIYIDPPYNTGGDGFPYKDSYMHSSWMAMVEGRLHKSRDFLSATGAIYSSIDENERDRLVRVFDKVFGEANRVEEVIWGQNTTKNQSPTFSTNHEYVPVYAKSLQAAKSERMMFRESKPGAGDVLDLVEEMNPDYPSLSTIEDAISTLFKSHMEELRMVFAEDGIEYDVKLDPWRGLFNYKHAEYRVEVKGTDNNGNNASNWKLVPESEACRLGATIWVWREDNLAQGAAKGQLKEDTKDPEHPNYRFYTPLHPNGNALSKNKIPKTGWRFPEKPLTGYNGSFRELDDDDRIVWGNDHLSKVPQIKRFLHEVETQVAQSLILDYTDGEKELTQLFGKSKTFPNPKPSTLIARFVAQASGKNDWVMDFFAGSGSTWQAVKSTNRDERSSRKVIMVEAGSHFEGILKARIKKLSVSHHWKNGIPEDRKGPGLFMRTQTLEQYEDTLENLAQETSPQQELPLDDPKLKLSYRMGRESQQVYCDIKQFRSPFGYQLHRAEGGGDAPLRDVDLVESLIYLLGIKVALFRRENEGVMIIGHDRRGRSMTVLFRDCNHANSSGWCQQKLQAHPADRVFTNAMAELSFEGCDRFEAIEDAFASQFSRAAYV